MREQRSCPIWLLLALALCFGCTPFGPPDLGRSPAPRTSAADACPVTKPGAVAHRSITERALPPIRDYTNGGQGLYGNEAVTVLLPESGELFINRPQVGADVKFGWWRHVGGNLVISGERLDGSAPPLGSFVPDGYGPSGFQAASLIFPTAGCWRVSGRVDGRSLEVVVRVIDAGQR